MSKKKADVTIEINEDVKCVKCHKGGATQNGLCLSCLSDKIRVVHLANWPDENVKFMPAPEIERLANDIIAMCPEMNYRREARIYYQLQQKMAPGHVGTASKVPAKYQDVIEYDFVLTFNWEIWKELTAEGKQRWVYHELCHVVRNEKLQWVIERHEFEGFVREWILYRDVIKENVYLGKIFKQAELELVSADK